MEYNLASSTGFSIMKAGDYLQEAATRIAAIQNKVDADTRGGALTMFDLAERRDEKIARTIPRSRIAYMTDGIIRQAVDKHAEVFIDFDLEGGEEQVDYLKQRLTLMSLQTGEHWKQTFSDGIFEYFLTGNPIFAKLRGKNPMAKRILYSGRPYPIMGLSLMGMDRVEAYRDKGKFKAWKLRSASTTDPNNGLILPGPKKMQGALIDGTFNSSGGLMYRGVDVLHIPYKRMADNVYGFGLPFTGLEDVALLRGAEQTTLTSIRKNSHPLIQHAIEKGPNQVGGMKGDMEYAASLHTLMDPSGVIITPGNHKITVHGMESMALRTHEYLRYFANRSFSSLGVSAFLMGFEPGNVGTSEAAVELMMQKIRFCQEEIARAFREYFFNELLWEGGFNPYFNEDDQVNLVFQHVDESRKIKLQTHAADMYAKGMVDDAGARDMGGIKHTPKDSGLYLNKQQIPLEQAKAKAKATIAAAKARATPTKTSSKKRGVSRRELLEKAKRLSLSIIPYKEEDVSDFVFLMERRHGINLAPLEEQLKLLAGDEHALWELIADHLESLQDLEDDYEDDED